MTSIFKIKTKVPLPNIGLFDKLKLLSGFRPNPKYKKLLELGLPKLKKKMDIVHILKLVDTGDDNTIDLDKPKTPKENMKSS